MNWLSDFFGRVGAGVSPWQALTTPTPQAGNVMGPNTYSSPQATASNVAQLQANTPPPQTGAVQGAATGPTAAYNPNTDPNLVGQARGQVQSLIPTLNGLYNDINGGIDNYAKDARTTLDNGYGTAYANDAQNLAHTNDATNSHFVGTGAYDSSARGNALQGNTDTFNQAEDALHTAQGQGQAQIGSIVANNKAAIAGGPPQYDLSQYTDVNSLLGLRDQLNQHIAGLTTQKQNLATPGQLRDQLNAVAPAKSTAGDALTTRLNALNASNAPAADKFGLAQGYISNAGLNPADQNKYLNYFQSLLGQGTKTSAA